MTRDHTLIEELLAVRSLDGLDGDDLTTLERELASHGDCDVCVRLADGFDETAGRLGLALEPVAVDPGMADSILRIARDGEGAAPSAVVVGDELTARRRRTWRGAVAVAASLVLLAAGIAIVRSDPGLEIVAAQRFVELDGDIGSFAVAYTPGEPAIVLWGRDLPDPGAGRVYELWTFTGGTPISRGCMRPIGGAMATVLEADLADAEQLAVTLESASCPDAPTTPPIFEGQLT
jgi:anti-sigma-K factor RskA